MYVGLSLCRRYRQGIPAEQQRIIFGGKQLSGADKQLSDFELEEGNTLHLVLRLRGGPSEEHVSNQPRCGRAWGGRWFPRARASLL